LVEENSPEILLFPSPHEERDRVRSSLSKSPCWKREILNLTALGI
jgi:hypothetical protein